MQKVQAIVFKKVKNKCEVLLLKRAADDGGFWQTVTGTVENNEELKECMVRELLEETNIEDTIRIIEDVHQFNWERDGVIMDELVFAVEVAKDTEVRISHEHEDYKWVGIDETDEYFTYDSSTESLNKLKKILKIS